MAAFETEKSAFESIKQKHEDEMTLLSDMDADLTAQKEAFAKEKADLEQERGAVDRATEKLLAAREAIARDQANLAQREAQLASSALPEFSAKEEWSKIEAAKKQIESERDVLAQDRIAIKQRELKLQESVGGHAKLKAVMDMDDLRASLERRHKEASKKLSDLNAREKALVQAEKDFEMYRQTATSATQPGSPTKFGQHMSTMIAQMQDEYQIRQKELDDAMEAFGAFKAKVEESLKQKEARLTEASQKLELDKRNLVEKHVAEKKEWEKKERDQTRLIERLKAVQLGDPDSIALSQEFIELETEKASVVALKLRLEDEADQMDKEKDKVEKEAAQLEHEWAVVKLKEAEVAKALADISVAAAQQAVGSSISTAETMLSRDRIRELEGQCKELSMENEELKSWTGSKVGHIVIHSHFWKWLTDYRVQQTLRKSRSLMGVAVNPLPGAAVVGKANETVPKTQEPNGASSDVLQAIADLTRYAKFVYIR